MTIISSPLSKETKDTGHYVQMVWGDTEEVGCGMVYYKSNCLGKYPKNEYYETLVVCNYAKSGNYLGICTIKATYVKSAADV